MSEGVRIERRRLDMVSPQERIRPLRDKIVIKPLEWRPSRILHIAGNDRKALRGTVVAVGPGYREKKRYRNSKGEVIAMGETGKVSPLDVKIGDTVELGGLEIDGYDFPQVLIGNEVHLICSERDVAGVVE